MGASRAPSPPPSGRCPRPSALPPIAAAFAAAAATAGVLAVGMEAVPAAAAAADAPRTSSAAAPPLGGAAPSPTAASAATSAPTAAAPPAPAGSSIASVLGVVVLLVLVAVVRSVRRGDVHGRFAQPSDLPVEFATREFATRAVQFVRRRHKCRCRACHVVVEWPWSTYGMHMYVGIRQAWTGASSSSAGSGGSRRDDGRGGGALPPAVGGPEKHIGQWRVRLWCNQFMRKQASWPASHVTLRSHREAASSASFRSIISSF